LSFQFKPAIRESVGLIVGLAGGTGSGKTYSALKLATGMAGGKPFALIDTEAGRARHYADQFKFDHGDLAPPFRPQAYAEAIFAADEADYPVIVVDSMSHEWAGEDGILDWHEQELQRMAGDDYAKREACKMAAWIKPKMDHKKMVQRLLQIRAHLILCFRAEEKVDMVRGDDGKMKIVPKVSRTGLDGWLPITEKALPYELTASFLLTADAPGKPKPIKLQEQHRGFFPLDKAIDEKCGESLAAWAKGAPAASTGAIGDPEREAFIDAMDAAETMPLLQAAFERAWKRASETRNSELRRAFKSTYDACLKKFAGATA
jgi:AAA domain